MWRGEDQALEEGWMIPSCSIFSNSFLAMLSLAGDNLLVAEWVGVLLSECGESLYALQVAEGRSVHCRVFL